MKNDGTLLDVFHFYMIEANSHLKKKSLLEKEQDDCQIKIALKSKWRPTPIVWNGWIIKYTIIDPIYGDEEWQATHENYDGAPDGNPYLYIHDSSLVDLLNELYELGCK